MCFNRYVLQQIWNSEIEQQSILNRLATRCGPTNTVCASVCRQREGNIESNGQVFLDTNGRQAHIFPRDPTVLARVVTFRARQGWRQTATVHAPFNFTDRTDRGGPPAGRIGEGPCQLYAWNRSYKRRNTLIGGRSGPNAPLTAPEGMQVTGR